MQPNSKTVAPKPHPVGAAAPLNRARSAVAQALQKYPVLSARELADKLKSSGGDYVAELLDLLLTDFYIRALRREQSIAEIGQLRLPGFDHLPAKIPGPKNQLVPLGKATYTRVRAYYWSLRKAYDTRKKNDLRILELKRLMDMMQKRVRRDPQVTVQEVLVIDA